MDDLDERLREMAEDIEDRLDDVVADGIDMEWATAMKDAADEIDTLRKRIAELERAGSRSFIVGNDP